MFRFSKKATERYFVKLVMAFLENLNFKPSDIKLGISIIINPKNIGNNTIFFFIYLIGMTAIVIVMSLAMEKSANF